MRVYCSPIIDQTYGHFSTQLLTDRPLPDNLSGRSRFVQSKPAADTQRCSGGLLTSVNLPLRGQHGSKTRHTGGELLNLCEEIQVDKAMDVLLRMDSVPTVNMYASLLKACAKRKALTQAKRVHAHLSKHGLESTKFLGENVVTTLVKCGGFADALQVFHKLPQRSVFSWTAVISGYCASGQNHEALRMYRLMQEEGVKPNAYTFVSLLKICSSSQDLVEGRRIHGDVLRYGCESDVFVGTCLVDMYGKSGSIVDAQRVFDELPQRDVVAWSALMAAYVEHGQPEEALDLYEEMWKEGVDPNDRIFVSLFQACGMLAEREEGVLLNGKSTKVKSSEKGLVIHAAARSKGYYSDVFIGSTLISMYGKCGRPADAQNVFDELPQHDLVLWNALLAAYVEQGESKKVLMLYEQMWEEGVSPDGRTMVSALQASSMLPEIGEDTEGRAQSQSVNVGKVIHAEACRKGYTSNPFVANTLVSMYGKCGSIDDAQIVFGGLSERDVVAWNALLGAYVENDEAEKALQAYEHLLEDGVSPDDRTFVTTLVACCALAGDVDVIQDEGFVKAEQALVKGKAIHAHAWRKGYDCDVFVGNTLVSMYAKCGSIAAARSMFDDLSCRNVVTWNALLVAYVDLGQAEMALELYGQMAEEGVSPNTRTYATAVRACGILADKEGYTANGRWPKVRSLETGRALHADAGRKGYDSDVFVGNSLVIMYGKCGSIEDAQSVFDGLTQRDLAAWTAMLAVYVEQGQADKALQLYSQMQQEGASPDEITLVWVLQACSLAGSLGMLQEMHHRLVDGGRKLSPLLGNSLITAFGRCASMVDGQAVFDALPEADVVSWNALIAGYARQGDTAESLQCYEKMRAAGMPPDLVTFVSLLSACSHAGLVAEGIAYFESMSRDDGITPEIEHYVCMVDLLGRAGCFDRIQELLARMPMQPSFAVWLCLLGACRKHGKVELGEQAFAAAVRLHPNHAAPYVLMSSIYADAGLVDNAKQIKNLRDAEVAWKKPGQSWIEHEHEVHTFLVGDLKHSQENQLYKLLKDASLELKEEGRIPQ